MPVAAPDRTVLTTGANSGIGLAIAVEVARRGFRSVGSVRSDAKAAEVERAARDAGVEVETVLLDVTDADRCAEVVDDLRPFGVVNNAGYGLSGAVEDVGDDEARQILETMVLAPVRLSRLALPGMREQGDGRIVMISSLMGRITTPLTGWYQGAKHALEAVTDALRMEVASSGVKVVLVEPGGFKTNIWDDHESDVEKRAGSRYETAYKRSLRLTRLGQPFMGDPAQVARVVTSALSSGRPRARYLVGYDAQAATLWNRVTPRPVWDLVSRRSLGL
jgi:NAD(P)-dependent dehydrogenase (short-subunit alcohol dehydrogenase family)